MANLNPITNGYIWINKAGAVYTRSTSAWDIKNNSGNVNVVAYFFDISALAGSTVLGITLNWGVSSVVSGTVGGDTISAVYIPVLESDTDSDIWNGVSNSGITYGSTLGTAGPKQTGLSAAAVTELQDAIDTMATQFPIGQRAANVGSSVEILLSSSPTLEVIIVGDSTNNLSSKKILLGVF